MLSTQRIIDSTFDSLIGYNFTKGRLITTRVVELGDPSTPSVADRYSTDQSILWYLDFYSAPCQAARHGYCAIEILPSTLVAQMPDMEIVALLLETAILVPETSVLSVSNKSGVDKLFIIYTIMQISCT